MSQYDDSIRKEIVGQIVASLGGSGLYGAMRGSALACTGAHRMAYLHPDARDPEAEKSHSLVSFNAEGYYLDTHPDTVGLTWATNGIGQSVHFYTIVQPDDTYSVFLLRYLRRDIARKVGHSVELIAESHDVYFDVLKDVVNQMFDNELAKSSR